MQTIKIEKLEELEGYEWEYKNKKFLLLDAVAFDDMLTLVEKNYIDVDGYMSEKRYRSFSLKNLTELEFFGLKVILNEKPKITRKEREFLEMLEDNQTYIAREDNPWGLRLFGFEPTQYDSEWLFIDGENEDGGICLKYELFPFITWKSGKAWSKAELMELEVED